MKTALMPTDSGARRQHGFALVATLMLMLLLGILAIGMLSLSSISVRSGGQNSAMSEAKANARMALMLAIGELQKQMGPDQRISANAEILDDPATPTNEMIHPHWTGVWDSWKAGPGEGSQHQTIQGISDTGMAPTYQSGRRDHFRKWLLSLSETDVNNVANPQDIAKELTLDGVPTPVGAETAVRLVGEGSLGPSALDEDFVSARLLPVSDPTGNTTGRYGWWIGDESQKARVMADDYARQEADPSAPPLTSAERIFRSQAPGSLGNTTVAGLAGMTDEQQLEGLPSLKSIDLVSVNPAPAAADPTISQRNFHHATVHSLGILADVREGGLKRDLNTILEQPINIANTGEEYMLYAFDDQRFPYLNNPNDAQRANSRVPIQDLAAYYQLYDHQPAFANGRREGVQYTSSDIRIDAPNYDGGSKNQQRLNREYTGLYRRPVVTKVQFLLGVTAQPITQEDRDRVQGIIDGTETGVISPYGYSGNGQGWRNNLEPIPSSVSHRLRLGIQPLVTLWNPTNLPLAMNSREIMTYNAPPFGIRIRKFRAAGGTPFDSYWMNLGYANSITNGTTAGQGGGALLRLRFADTVFEPGEVKVFSLQTSAAKLTEGGGTNVLTLNRSTTFNVINEWDPYGAFLMRNSAPAGNYGDDVPDVYTFTNDGFAGNQGPQCLVFGPDDKISISIDSESASTATNFRDGRNASRDAEIRGAGFGLHMVDEGFITGNPQTDALRHEFMISRHGSQIAANQTALGGFYQELMRPSFPGGVAPVPFDSEIDAIPGSEIIGTIGNDEIIAIMDFSLSRGCEFGSAGGFGGARRIASRPFLHSAYPAFPFISDSARASLYDYGLDWQVNKINAVEDSILRAEPGTGNGYYGGGYTEEKGTTHVIQTELPVLPPISIASLSHAYLGGFSMAKAIPVGENPDTDKYNFNQAEVQNPTGVSFQRTTASGQNGLAPHTVQAIGNSYAHPNIPPDKAFVTKTRIFDMDEGAKSVPFVDHSYLANKALWDEFFFSSITPQPSKVEWFGGTARTVKEVAQQFLLPAAPLQGKPLPNRRIMPYTSGLTTAKLDSLFTEADKYTDGLADKIAAYLLVEGAFNVNSTSVEAWKALLSSMRGKPVAYLPSGKVPATANTTGTPVSPGSLPTAAPVTSDQITAANQPPGQWAGGRELTDAEIDALAKAIVYQVKLRGPFLSLSEFVNRRLDASNTNDMALKGALQAALDDPGDPADPANRPPVPINASFRQPGRTLDAEVAAIDFENGGNGFQKAATGPAAYGSTAYVDQADVLRGIGSQLSPRGDTFVIRSYGDALDASGKVVARAWCEAVVQRVPDYVDDSDANEVKTAALTSEANRRYGRKFQISSLRWLNPNEV